MGLGKRCFRSLKDIVLIIFNEAYLKSSEGNIWCPFKQPVPQKEEVEPPNLSTCIPP